MGVPWLLFTLIFDIFSKGTVGLPYLRDDLHT